MSDSQQPPHPSQQPQQTPQQTPQQPPPALDQYLVNQCAALAHTVLKESLGMVGRPEQGEIARALHQALSQYGDPTYQPAERYVTLALLEGRLMLVLDHEAWGWQVFVVASPACPLPGRQVLQPQPEPTDPTDEDPVDPFAVDPEATPPKG